MRSALKQAGAEQAELWCFHEEKEFPDLVLEIALTSGGFSKRKPPHVSRRPQLGGKRVGVTAYGRKREKPASAAADPHTAIGYGIARRVAQMLGGALHLLFGDWQ